MFHSIRFNLFLLKIFESTLLFLAYRSTGFLGWPYTDDPCSIFSGTVHLFLLITYLSKDETSFLIKDLDSTSFFHDNPVFVRPLYVSLVRTSWISALYLYFDSAKPHHPPRPGRGRLTSLGGSAGCVCTCCQLVICSGPVVLQSLL